MVLPAFVLNAGVNNADPFRVDSPDNLSQRFRERILHGTTILPQIRSLRARRDFFGKNRHRIRLGGVDGEERKTPRRACMRII